MNAPGEKRGALSDRLAEIRRLCLQHAGGMQAS